MMNGKERPRHTDHDTIRDAIAEALRARGMTAADLGRACGVSGTAARNWVAGRATPLASQLPSIALALGGTIIIDGMGWMISLEEETDQ